MEESVFKKPPRPRAEETPARRPSSKRKGKEKASPSQSSGEEKDTGPEPSQSPPLYVSPYPPLPSSSVSAASSRASSVPILGAEASSSHSVRFDIPDYQGSTIVSNMPSKTLTIREKETLLRSLLTHRVNTIIELRRIERALAGSPAADVTDAMTKAWARYVNSNNLLSELRGLTKTYPFSSECLDEAKWMVIADPQSAKSWNYCWLVLRKVREQGLIPKHARALAIRPAMWGGNAPSPQGVEQLASACTAEWTRALLQMLRHWEVAPVTR